MLYYAYCHGIYTFNVQEVFSWEHSEKWFAWWGQPELSLCSICDADINTIVCNTEDEETMVSTQSTSWMEYILTKGQALSVCDLYTPCGKAVRMT